MTDETAAATGDRAAVLGVDLGGTNLRVAVVAAGGEIVARVQEDTPQDDPDALPRLMQRVAAQSDRLLSGAVVGVPALVDYRQGETLRLPNLPAWEGHVAAQSLADVTGLPVLLANDADLAALGEQRYGAGRGVDDMVYVTISTGVGAGVILGGRLVHGRHSLAEVGHTVIDYRAPQGVARTVEELGSGTALERLSGVDGAEVTRRAQAGDGQALAWFREIGAAFGAGIANLIECFMPQRVVVGGGVSAAGDLVLAPIREQIAGSRLATLFDPREVVLASGGDDVGLRGAFALWTDASQPRLPATTLTPFAPRSA